MGYISSFFVLQLLLVLVAFIFSITISSSSGGIVAMRRSVVLYSSGGIDYLCVACRVLLRILRIGEDAVVGLAVYERLRGLQPSVWRALDTLRYGHLPLVWRLLQQFVQGGLLFLEMQLLWRPRGDSVVLRPCWLASVCRERTLQCLYFAAPSTLFSQFLHSSEEQRLRDYSVNLYWGTSDGAQRSMQLWPPPYDNSIPLYSSGNGNGGSGVA